jgi:hypothetical protein
LRLVKYIGFYINDINNITRNGSIAASNKMDYITSAINELGYKVEIISPSWFADKSRLYSKSYKFDSSDTKSIVFAPSFIANNKLTRYLRTLLSKLWLLKYILLNSKEDEDIIVYHSLALINTIKIAKMIKKFNLILETNEIYSDVIKYPNYIVKNEYRIFKEADKFIFSTELLNKKLNILNKPYAINHGTYFVEKDRGLRFQDGRIHVVYAGIIDSQKGGAITAAVAAQYLDSNYHLHIIGFGNENNICELNDLISNISKKTECTLSYDGLLKGEEYITFLQKCHIGLSTQTSIGSYNETSFPSKVLSYLSNGLRVVSIRIKAIDQSKISDIIYFYNQDAPEEVANAIKDIDISESYNSKEKISELHTLFLRDLENLMSE